MCGGGLRRLPPGLKSSGQLMAAEGESFFFEGMACVRLLMLQWTAPPGACTDVNNVDWTRLVGNKTKPTNQSTNKTKPNHMKLGGKRVGEGSGKSWSGQ